MMKAAWLAKGPNLRFLLTHLARPAQDLCDPFYVQRGADSEHMKLGQLLRQRKESDRA